ncbi:linear amide C-N hydrolase [Paenibacillus sp. CMAA1364]
MCTTIGFSYSEGVVLGRTLEVGMKLDNHMMVVPRNIEDFIHTKESNYASKYAVLGTGFFKQTSFGDGINEMGLMGSSNLLPGYASFSKNAVEDKINVILPKAFDYLLSRCKDVEEVREEAQNLVILEQGETAKELSTNNHFFFMDAKGMSIVLEPKEGQLLAYDNPYGVLTNAPEFPWHVTNLKNYIHLQPENVEQTSFNGATVTKFGEGSGLVGLPGDFTPPSRFVRAAFFVSSTPKDLDRQSAILQGFRILSQSDIPTGSVIDTREGHKDETLYTSVMDTKSKGYFVKCHDNINLQAFYLDDYKDNKEILFIELEKQMQL